MTVESLASERPISFLNELGGDWWSTEAKIPKRNGRKTQKPDFIAEGLDWKIHRAAKIPGPGNYDTHTRLNPISGGRISTAQVPSFVDFAINHGKITPGPGEYNVEGAMSHSKQFLNGGRFNMSNPKSYIDWEIYRCKSIPGPCTYEVPDFISKGSHGGKFNMANAKSEMEWKIYHAKSLPAPGQYDTLKPSLPVGGKFSSAVVKTDMDWEIFRAKSLPGPCDYNLQKFGISSGKSGMKFNESHSKSDLEWTIYRASKIPGPGEYGVRNAAAFISRTSPKFTMSGRTGPSMPKPYDSLTSTSTSSIGRASTALAAERSQSSLGAEVDTVQESRSSSSLPPLETTHRIMTAHVKRIKTATVKSAMIRKARGFVGFGKSFFI